MKDSNSVANLIGYNIECFVDGLLMIALGCYILWGAYKYTLPKPERKLGATRKMQIFRVLTHIAAILIIIRLLYIIYNEVLAFIFL